MIHHCLTLGLAAGADLLPDRTAAAMERAANAFFFLHSLRRGAPPGALGPGEDPENQTEPPCVCVLFSCYPRLFRIKSWVVSCS